MKKISIIIWLGLLCIYQLPSMAAVKIVECEDEQGARSFQRNCPPGSKMVGERNYSTGANSGSTTDRKTGNISATLYLIPNCDVCQDVKDFLSARNIPVSEKNVKDNFELQEELKEKTGGDLQVPVVVIGTDVIKGYQRNTLLKALQDAGYSEPEEKNAAGDINSNWGSSE